MFKHYDILWSKQTGFQHLLSKTGSPFDMKVLILILFVSLHKISAEAEPILVSAANDSNSDTPTALVAYSVRDGQYFSTNVWKKIRRTGKWRCLPKLPLIKHETPDKFRAIC